MPPLVLNPIRFTNPERQSLGAATPFRQARTDSACLGAPRSPCGNSSPVSRLRRLACRWQIAMQPSPIQSRLLLLPPRPRPRPDADALDEGGHSVAGANSGFARNARLVEEIAVERLQAEAEAAATCCRPRIERADAQPAQAAARARTFVACAHRTRLGSPSASAISVTRNPLAAIREGNTVLSPSSWAGITRRISPPARLIISSIASNILV